MASLERSRRSALILLILMAFSSLWSFLGRNTWYCFLEKKLCFYYPPRSFPHSRPHPFAGKVIYHRFHGNKVISTNVRYRLDSWKDRFLGSRIGFLNRFFTLRIGFLNRFFTLRIGIEKRLPILKVFTFFTTAATVSGRLPNPKNRYLRTGTLPPVFKKPCKNY